MAQTTPVIIVHNPINGHFYQFVSTTLDFETAVIASANLPTQCGQLGHVVTITSDAERDFINNHVDVGFDDAYWIGLTDDPNILNDQSHVDGTWVWVDSGNETDYDNWALNEGGGGIENCVTAKYSENGTWFQESCNGVPHPYIVEFDCKAPYFDFDMELDLTGDPVNITLSTDTDIANDAIHILYEYTGPNPISSNGLVTFQYTILDYNCTSIFAAYDDSSQALKFTNFTYQSGQVQANLGIALNQIETATTVWSHPPNDETIAFLQFCGRWDIYVNGVYMTFHELMINATIRLTENQGFDVSNLDAIELNPIDTDTQSQQVAVQFPVSMYFCNETAEAEEPPNPVYQGTTIQLCLKLATPATNGVYLHSIDEMTYLANQYTGNAVALFENGELKYKSTTQVDCVNVPSLCRVKFLAKAEMFVDVDTTNTNNLIIAGLAVVALGSDPDGSIRRQRRHLLLEDGDRLSPFQFVLENLQPLPPDEDSSAAAARSEFLVIILAVVGGVFFLVVIVAVVAYVRFQQHRQTTTTVVMVKKKAAGAADDVDSKLSEFEKRDNTAAVQDNKQPLHEDLSHTEETTAMSHTEDTTSDPCNNRDSYDDVSA